MELYKAIVCVCLTTILVTDIVFAAPSMSRDLTKLESAPVGISKGKSALTVLGNCNSLLFNAFHDH